MLSLSVRDLKAIIHEDHDNWESVQEILHPPQYDATPIDVIFTKREDDTYRKLEEMPGPFYMLSYTRYGTSSSGYIEYLAEVRFDMTKPLDPKWDKLVECPEVHLVPVTIYKWEAING